MLNRKVVPAQPAMNNYVVCSRCHHQANISAKIILACACQPNPYAHEYCLQTQITRATSQNPMAIAPTEFPNFMKYKCPGCQDEILFRRDFSSKIISCAQMKKMHLILLAIMIISFLLTVGVVAFVLLTAVDSDLIVYVALGSMLVVYALFVILMLKRIFSRKFYKIEGGMGYGEVYVRDM